MAKGMTITEKVGDCVTRFTSQLFEVAGDEIAEACASGDLDAEAIVDMFRQDLEAELQYAMESEDS